MLDQLLGHRVRVHRPRAGDWYVLTCRGGDWRIETRAARVSLRDAITVIDEEKRQLALRGGSRNAHAWVEGLVTPTPGPEDLADRALRTYSTEDGFDFESAPLVVFEPAGMFAIRPNR
jgi:hypothetical protein